MTSRNITQRPECHTCRRAAPGKEFTVIKQEFGMEAGGKASVDKLGQHVERDPSEA